MFKKFLFLVMFLSVATVARAQSHQLGAGIIVGAPTGFSFNYVLSSRNSVDGAIGWSDSISYNLHSDYLWFKPNLFPINKYPVDLFYGLGGSLRNYNSNHYGPDDDGTHIGVRAPIGLRMMFRDPRFEIFSEISATMDITPSTHLNLDLGIGVRYYF